MTVDMGVAIQLTGITRAQIQKAAGEGKIPGAVKVENRWFFDPKGLREWKRSRRRGSYWN